jgi:PPOX class probable F420-dependent enzyme
MLSGPAKALIDDAKSLQLATIDADGSPHLSTLWFGWLDGEIVAWTMRDSHKARNLRRNPRVACLVDAGTGYGELRGVSMRGRVELTDDPDRLRAIATAVFQRNYPPEEQPDVEAMVAAGRRVGMIMHVERSFSWDARGSGRRLPQP